MTSPSWLGFLGWITWGKLAKRRADAREAAADEPEADPKRVIADASGIAGADELKAYLRRINRSRLSRYGCFIQHRHRHHAH